MKKNGISNTGFLALILVIAGFAGHGFYTFQKEIRLMEEASVEDIFWTSYQLEQELARFRQSLLGFQVEGSGVDAAEINERFDILWSRIALFQQGSVGERLLAYGGELDVVESLFSRMKEVDRRVVDLADGDYAEAAYFLEQFSTYPERLRDLSRAVTSGEESRNREIRNALSFGVNRTMILAGIATGMAIFAIIYIYRQALMAQHLADVNRRLASLAEKASKAKSQFLTMMSHELRTPMNGVIGLLAVVKQHEVDVDQIMLIDAADASAKNMLGLLGDVFDYSALQSETVGIVNRPFEVEELKKAIEVNAPVTVAEGCPKLFIGDFARLRQALNHLSQYIIETAGTRDVTYKIDGRDGEMVAQLSFCYPEDGGAWNPDLVLGSDDREGDKFATDALGLTLSRGLIAMMDGVITLDKEGARIVVESTLPLEAFEVSEVLVKVLANSDVIPSLCRAMIKADAIKFLDGTDERTAHIVLIESGNSTETEFIRKVRDENPSALLVALGRPIDPEAFDFATEIPLNFQKLQDIILRQLA